MPDGSSLRDYLVRKAAAMRAAALRRPRGEDWHEVVEATCVADDATGVRKLRIRDWQLLSDSGPDFGGWGLGPSSPELLCGVLSTCLTHTCLIEAANRAIPLGRVEVRVTAQNNDARFVGVATDDPPRPWGFVAHIRLEAPDADPSALAGLQAAVAEHCPLTQLIRLPGAIDVVFS